MLHISFLVLQAPFARKAAGALPSQPRFGSRATTELRAFK